MEDEDVTVDRVSEGVVVARHEEGDPCWGMTTRDDRDRLLDELADADDGFAGVVMAWREGTRAEEGDGPGSDLVRGWFEDERTVWKARVPS